MKVKMPDLSRFTGTEAYHRLSFSNLKFTDGWKCLAQEVGAFWLADVVASVQYLPKIKSNDFIVWKIVVKDNKATIGAYSDCEEDGSFSKEKELYSQEVGYTDFPEGNFEWYQEGDVVLLKQEH